MKNLALALLLLSSLGPACGGNDENADDAPDAGGPPDGPDLTTGKIAAVAGDFNATGVLTTIEAPSMQVVTNAVAGVVGADPAIRRLDDELFVINRFGGDNLTILDGLDLSLVDQIGTGAGSNPQDVAQVGRKLYVPALAEDSLLVIDRDAPDTIARIDLSTLDDDGVPDCGAAHAVGTRVFVTCALLDNFNVVEPGVLVVIDTTDDSVETTIDLPFGNPGGFTELDGDLYVSTVPSYTDPTDGCLVRITTGGTPTATCAVTNASIAGFVSALVRHGTDTWAIRYAYDAEFNATGELVPIDLEAGTIGEPLTPDTMLVQDAIVCGGHLFLADKAPEAQGVRVYRIEDSALVERTSAAIDLGLPPVYGGSMACMVVPL